MVETKTIEQPPTAESAPPLVTQPDSTPSDKPTAHTEKIVGLSRMPEDSLQEGIVELLNSVLENLASIRFKNILSKLAKVQSSLIQRVPHLKRVIAQYSTDVDSDQNNKKLPEWVYPFKFLDQFRGVTSNSGIRTKVRTLMTGKATADIDPQENEPSTIDEATPTQRVTENPRKPKKQRRPLFVRVARRRLYNEMHPIKKIIAKAHALDEVAAQLLNEQHNITVNLGELGNQTARYVFLSPPEQLEKTEENKDLPPIVFIGGWGADLKSFASAATELVMNGRKVLMVAYPDSQFGIMSPEFVTAVQNSNTLAPHAEFFTAVINQVLPNEKIEVWGLSMGALTLAECLQNKDFADRVSGAVLYGAPGLVQMSSLQQSIGYLSEIRQLIKENFLNFANYEYVTGRVDERGYAPAENEKAKREQSVFRNKFVWPKVLGIARKLSVDRYESAANNLPEGTKMLFVSGKRDNATKCAQGFNNGKPTNQKINCFIHPSWGHQDLIVTPEVVIPEIFSRQYELQQK